MLRINAERIDTRVYPLIDGDGAVRQRPEQPIGLPPLAPMDHHTMPVIALATVPDPAAGFRLVGNVLAQPLGQVTQVQHTASSVPLAPGVRAAIRHDQPAPGNVRVLAEGDVPPEPPTRRVP